MLHRIIVRVTPSTKKALTEVMKRGIYMNTSEFVRSAIRQKIQKEYYDVYLNLFKEEQKKENVN
jgi:Arc/MetJ-type ribon-helix-helix transcriptional regulator